MPKYEIVYPKNARGHSLVKLDGEEIARFKSSSDASEFLRLKTDPSDLGKQLARADYWKDVRDTAESIKSELEDRIKDGVRGESLRGWLIEYVHGTIDGSARTIYTQQAKECLLYSDNNGAYFDEFGSEGAIDEMHGGSSEINWSRIAFSAFEADVIEQLGALGVDYNEPDKDSEEAEEAESVTEHE